MKEVLDGLILIPIGNTSLLLAIGLIALIGGSHFAVIHAESIAILLNVPQLVIGLTIIAIGTSLPELAATISAITKNKNDMVIGKKSKNWNDQRYIHNI